VVLVARQGRGATPNSSGELAQSDDIQVRPIYMSSSVVDMIPPPHPLLHSQLPCTHETCTPPPPPPPPPLSACIVCAYVSKKF
jgi:hypothetical protein